MLENNRLNLSQVSLGEKLPAWSIESIFGDELPVVEDYIGKPLLVLIFSFACPGCVGRAVPFANRMVYEHGNKINVIGIHTNFEGIDFPDSKFKEAKDEFFTRFPFFKDINYDTTFLNYGAGGTPHWFLTDKEGRLEYSIFGSDPNNALLRLDLKMNEILA